MKPKLLFLFLLLNFNLTLVAPATVRYVSKTGSSTPPYTTWATASDSIQKCINICQSGDTVYVANDVYKEYLVVNKQVSLIGNSMDSTIINSTLLSPPPLYSTVHFQTSGTIENFNIIGRNIQLPTSTCIGTLSGNLVIRNCRLSNANDAIFLAEGSSVIENLIIANCESAINISCFSNNCNYEIKNNVIYLEEFQPMIYLDASGTTKIYNNILINPFYREAIKFDYAYHRRAEIYNNLICGFEIGHVYDVIEYLIDSLLIYNNITRDKKGLAGASIIIGEEKVAIKNNIIMNNTKGINRPVSINENYNLFWNNVLNSSQPIGVNSIEKDPMLMNDTVARIDGNYDYHLQEHSPAIDAGDPNIIDVDGTRSDIGMYGGPFGEITYYKDLAPKPPRNLSALVDTNKITVRWKGNTEADTSYYKVYRDTVQNFVVDSTKLIGSPIDSFFIHSTLPIGRYFYKVTCVDNQGLESKPSEEIAVNITSIRQLTDDYPMTIKDYLLYQNYPNPFNPSTTIGYKLKERGYVKLMVYDIKGELVSVLVNQEQEAGYYEVEFSVSSIQYPASSIMDLASGIYLYRIEVIGEGNIPIYTEMKKMIVIK